MISLWESLNRFVLAVTRVTIHYQAAQALQALTTPQNKSPPQSFADSLEMLENKQSDKTMQTITPTQKLKRALWLTFHASSAVGMGFLHANQANTQTEDTLFQLANPDGGNRIDTDYLCGRMMKTEFSITDEGELQIWPETPRTDYQSWGIFYTSAEDIKKAVEASFQTE